jgi:hypothetical protein
MVRDFQRDYQRSKAYDAEELVFEGSSAESSAGTWQDFETLAECERYLLSVLGTHAFRELGVDGSWERPPRLEAGRGASKAASADAIGHKIVLPTSLRKRWIILHELSHLAASHIHERVWVEGRGYYYIASRSISPHGPEYAGIFLHLVRGLFGEHASCALRAAYKEKGVKVLSVEEQQRLCRLCGGLLGDHPSRPRRFCSDRCRWISNNRERRSRRAIGRIKACQACQKSFYPKREDARFCSAACKQRAYRLRATSM